MADESTDLGLEVGIAHAKCPECGQFCSLKDAKIRFRRDGFGDYAVDGIVGVSCPVHGSFESMEWYWLDEEGGVI